MKRLTLTVLLVLLTCSLQAQSRRGVKNTSAVNTEANANQAVDTSAAKGLIYNVEIPDSVLRRKVFFFSYHPNEVKIGELWSPFLDPTGAQFNDPLDALNGNYYLGKGVVGHPHLALYPTPAQGLFYRMQPDENIVYAKRPENVRLYQTMTPYTSLSYGSSLKKDYTLHLTHTQNILPGWNIAADYQLICPEGVFSNSAAKNHYLDFSTNYFSRDARLQAVLGLIMDSYTIGENGGLQNDSYFTDGGISNFAGLPVNITDSSSRHERRNLYGRVSYNMVRQFEYYRYRDSIVAVSDTLQHDSIWFDTIQLTDTIRVTKPHILNPGVFGVEGGYDHHRRWFAYNEEFLNQHTTLFWTNDAYADHRWHNPLKITIGLRQEHLKMHTLNATLSSTVRFSPFVRVETTMGRSLIKGEAEMGNALSGFSQLRNVESDYRFAGSYTFAFDTTRHTLLSIGAIIQQKMPDFRMLYDAGYSLRPIKTEHFELKFLYNRSHYDDQGLPMVDIGLRASHLSHNNWYDSTLAVVQGNNDFWIYQASLTLRLAWRWLHFDMQQLLQYTTDSLQMPVPLWASKNSLYVDFVLIKNALRVQIGGDLRYHSAFYSDTYDPYTGLFVRQNDVKVGDYIWADLFINFQVKRATIYLKAGHINTIWDKSRNYFLLPHYPGQKFGLYWGITWHFFD